LRRILSALTVLGALTATTGQAVAGTIFATPANSTNSFNNHPIAASADFSISGSTLNVVLTNTNAASIAKYVPSDALLAIFFDVAGDPALTYGTAKSSSIRTGTTVNSGPVDITSQWAYAFKSTGLGGAVTPLVTEHYGLGSAGFGIFSGLGGGQQFNYGIMDNGFTGTNGNNPVKTGTFAQNSIAFSLKFSGSLTESDIRNVRFQWGTALDEGKEPGLSPNAVPEPASLALLGPGIILGLWFAQRRRKRR
jgi:hypothetical protein